MNTTLKFYKYYLKRMLKSWYFWIFAVIGLIQVFFLPFLIYSRGVYSYNYRDESKVLYKDKYPKYKEFIKNEFFSFQKKGKGVVNFVYLDEKATEFMYFTKETDSGYIFKSCWKIFRNNYVTGLGIWFLIFIPIYYLIRLTNTGGEDKTVLITTSPITRYELIISKFLALFSFFYLGVLFTVTLPYFFYYCWLGSLNAQSIIIFLFCNLIIFPVLYFLFYHAIHIYLNSLEINHYLVNFANFFFVFSPVIFKFAVGYLMGQESLYKIEKVLENILVIIPMALFIGFSFLFLYWKKFTRKDFN